ncbi:MAG: HEAT repeat domain-containing protein [Nannocystaceae bacterium]
MELETIEQAAHTKTPLLTRLVSELSRLPEDATGDQIMQPLRQNNLGAVLAQFLSAELRNIKADPEYITPGTDSELIVWANDRFAMMLRMFDGFNEKNGDLIAGLGADVHVFNPTGSRASVPCFQESLAGGTVEDRPSPLRPAPALCIPARGFTQVAQSSGIVPDLENAVAKVLFFVFSRRNRSTVWIYERQSLAPAYVSATNSQWSRVGLAVRLFAEMRYAPAAVVVDNLAATSPEHFVRWECVRALARLDSSLVENALARASKDQHSHVRRAAERAIHNLQRINNHAS